MMYVSFSWTRIITLDANVLFSRTQKGPSYPYYYPYFDVNEKFPPTEIFGK